MSDDQSIPVTDWGNRGARPDAPDRYDADGRPLWMFHQGQRHRFYDVAGQQVGPEHAHLAAAVTASIANGWTNDCYVDPPQGIPDVRMDLRLPVSRPEPS